MDPEVLDFIGVDEDEILVALDAGTGGKNGEQEVKEASFHILSIYNSNRRPAWRDTLKGFSVRLVASSVRVK